MKKLGIKLLVIVMAFVVSSISVSAEEGHSKSVEQILDQLKSDQEVNSIESLDCSNITNEQFEELGDAVMGIMHPENDEHELMDNMMGGEGSESLEAAHITMGKRYLGCWGSNTNSYGYGMMGGGHMYSQDGRYSMPYWNQSSTNNNLWTFLVITGVALFGLIIGLLIMIKILFFNKDSLQVLKTRLASGDISEKTYQNLKKELSKK